MSFDIQHASCSLHIETDACDGGMGAVLVQDDHPVGYMSKALGVKNQKLSTYEPLDSPILCEITSLLTANTCTFGRSEERRVGKEC